MHIRDYPSEQLMRKLEHTPLPRNVGALIEERANAHPDRVLLDMFEDGEALTYHEFNERVRALASGLHGLGVRPGTHVGVMVYSTPVYPVSWLALAVLGAVTVPINFNYTARELRHMIEDSDAEFLIIEHDLIDKLEGVSLPRGRIVAVDRDRQTDHARWHDLLAAGDKHFRPEREPALDDTMNIQYTSGTTGMPKGAVLTQRSLMLHGRIGSAQALDGSFNLLIAQPFYYITGEWQFLMSILQGGTAYFPRKQSSTRFMEWVRKYHIHYCNFPEIVARAPTRPEDADNDLKVLYCYSHPPANYRSYEKRYGCLARQGFSMTETGIVLYVPMEADHMTGSGSVGIPAAFREVMVADPAGRPVPDGELGEICVRGPGVTQGYYKKPEANKATFHAGGWFRTGDLGRRNADGWFWYLGRLKDMVKRSGENVSATEVESVLRMLPGIAEAAVLPVPDPIRSEEVKAYILPAEGYTREDVPPQAILDHCAANLARFKIPRYIEYVTEFPRTPGLKIKKSTLIAAKQDLTTGCYDAAEKVWR